MMYREMLVWQKRPYRPYCQLVSGKSKANSTNSNSDALNAKGAREIGDHGGKKTTKAVVAAKKATGDDKETNNETKPAQVKKKNIGIFIIEKVERKIQKE